MMHGTTNIKNYKYWLASDRDLKWEGRKGMNINACLLQGKITLKYCYEAL